MTQMTQEERDAIIDAAPGIEIRPGGGVFVKQLPMSLLANAKVNPRAIKPSARKYLDGMLNEFDMVDVLTYNRRTGEIVGGNQRLVWLRNQGAESIAVAVVDVDPTKQTILNVGLNNPKAQGHFTEDTVAVLANIQPIVPDLYDSVGLSALIKQSDIAHHTRSTLQAGGADPDDEPELAVVQKRCAEGDVWLLGGSRLCCGDSTKPEEVDRAIGALKIACVVTDPPYAIYGSSTGVASDVADDKMVRPFFLDVWRTVHRVLPKFGHAYLFCDWRSWSAVWESAKRAGMSPKNMLVWDKGGGGLGSNYANTYELLAFFAKMPTQRVMKGDTETGQRSVHRPNILRFSRPTGDDRLHNAAKPVMLLKELIENSTDEGAGVLDLFGGSGSTLIAASMAARRCAMLEIEPERCDVIIARFERITGLTAQKEAP